jgi:transcriptional regulator with XRE-family HTH domain
MTRDRIDHVPRPKKPTPEGFPTRLEAAMARKGLNQGELAAKAGLASGSVVSHWLSGDRGPSGNALVAVARALDVTVEELAGKDTDVRELISPGRPHVYTDPIRELPEGLKAALDSYEWPAGLPAAVVATVSDALSKDAFAHRGSYIPPSYWKSRIAEELAARKGKRIVPPPTELDDGESPEVRDYKSKKRRQSPG